MNEADAGIAVPFPKDNRFIDRSGNIFGKLTVLYYAGSRKGRKMWMCGCQCGSAKVVDGSHLVRGNIRSCGCLQTSHQASRSNHGLSGTSEYAAWNEMLRRCSNPSHISWPNYGGRGITVCERWKDFRNFIADIGAKPSRRHSLDRINNNGNYEPGNCRWATVIQQHNNTRTNKRFECNGETRTVAEWSQETGVKYSTIRERLKRGWPVFLAISHPA